jgi:outer membrane protein TolC
MMRWLAGSFAFLLAVSLVTGCSRQCFLTKEDFNDAHSILLPTSMEKDYAINQHPFSLLTASPPTVNSPDRTPRYMSLQEAIAISLENGTASTRTLQGANGPGSGTYDTTLFSAPPLTGSQTGNLVNFTDYIRVLTANPAIAFADVEGALSKFDASWITTMNWTNTDNLLQGLNSFQNGESAAFQSGIVKALASGGFASVTFAQNYQLLTQPPTGGAFSILNPLYTSQVIFGFEQPLARNFGDHINQLLSGISTPITGIGVPGQIANLYGNRVSQLLQSGSLIAADGILIARLRFDQQRADFERVMQGLILQTEVAYWNLYNAYGQLYSFEESLRIAHRAWMIAHAQLVAGKINAADYAPVRGQYEDFRTQRAQALGNVLDAERNLRGIIGLLVEDGCRIVPITPPSLAHLEPDWASSMTDALNLRPELVMARDNLRLSQYNLEVSENFLKPDIRFAAQYVPQGFGTRLDGRSVLTMLSDPNQPANALASLASGHFANATVGLTANVPLGFRLENAGVRAAKLLMAQNYYLVKDQEQKATSALVQSYQKLQEWYKRIETTRAARKAYAEAVDVRFKKIVAGAALADISFLDFQAKLATAQAAEYAAIAEYNNSLARFEWTKGTILKYNNVHIAEGPLPQCAQVRAVEHEKERSKALVLCERPEPLTHPGRLAHTTDIPPMDTPRPLPMFEQPPTPLPEQLPQPAPLPAPPSAPQASPQPGPVSQNQLPELPGVVPAAAQQDPATLANPVVPAELTFRTPPAGLSPQALPSLAHPAMPLALEQPVPELQALPARPALPPMPPMPVGNPR